MRRGKLKTPVALGIEGGGTKTVALTSDGRRRSFGPLNLKLASDRQILDVLRQVKPARAAICLAGCRTESDRQRIRRLAARAWGNVPAFIGNDIDSGHAATFGVNKPGILVISGTGSVVFGRNEAGQTARAGGWGHLLGDHGSGYWIAMTGLRNAVREYDRRGSAHPRLLRQLCLDSMDQLVDWIQQACKDEIAALAPMFLREKAGGLLLQAASFLAQDVHAVAGKLSMTKPDVKLAGGVLQNNLQLRRWVTHRIRTMLPGAKVSIFRGDTATGALHLTGRALAPRAPRTARRAVPTTELRNPRTMDLDKRSVSQLVDTMLREESRVIPAIRANRRAIERAINTIVVAFKRGGRLFYIGAGTSGRLGVLDASECPPTFSTDPGMVQAIIAGGAPALHRAIEAAEDDPLAGADAVRQRGVTGKDVVIGIAASGTTPFVLGALDKAKRIGAKTFLLSFAGKTNSLAFDTGPEIIAGSTRLKAGTATKLVLNMLTTISMIRLGKVVSNLMVDVKPTNEKLRARACRIVATLRGCGEDEARGRLTRANWNVKKALR